MDMQTLGAVVIIYALITGYALSSLMNSNRKAGTFMATLMVLVSIFGLVAYGNVGVIAGPMFIGAPMILYMAIAKMWKLAR